MKKSTKLIIGLTFLAATVTAASVAIAVTTITRKTPKKQLSKQIKIFEEELETNKELKEFQKAEIKLALEAAQAVLSNPESSDEQIKNALDVLVKKVEEIKAKTEEPETPEQQLAKAKAAYNEKVSEAEQLVTQLTTDDNKYQQIKETLETEVAAAKADVPADNPTKENYKSATEKLTAAITKATEAKKAIDQEIAEFEEAKNSYNEKVSEAEQLVTQLTTDDNKYQQIKETLETEVAAAKADVPADNPTKENYKSATEKLTAAITKATEAKKAIDQEIAQQLIIDTVKNKKILITQVDEKIKSVILKLSSNKIKNSPTDKNYFGYLKFNKETKTFTFGPSDKKAKTAFSGVSFASEFLDMVANKEIVFAGSGPQKALCFDKKSDGKIVIPFRFKDKTEVYEIELFQI
ncbi:Uncharacterised protein [Mycoplasmopsis arginini]|uniref:hypothetical protein n=4 Tax=Bacteria TaxID=2 RepID=UPI000A27E1E6|nr:Uncharacterised protein [Mycoplasmopsis arginini]SGA30689.1 Uncharacterised protein [Mycoplasmopsis arginini]SGA33471.1 Uncharacterised protein [Chlamydia abortus]